MINMRAGLLGFWLLVSACLALAAADARAEGDKVRLAIVNTPKISGLIDMLVKEFKTESGIDVEVYGGSDVYAKARAGEADLVISHYGKADVEAFVTERLGLWPKMVFSNQLAIIGPKSDPAKIKGLTSAAEALKRIAEAGAPFVVNELHGIGYISSVLWNAAGNPPKGAWYIEGGVSKGRSIKLAEERQAYVIWGAIPFLRFKDKHASAMELMVTSDPILHRVMASILVNPEKISGINAAGAAKFEQFLLTARVQALIAAYRSPGADVQLWWPAARNNASEGLDE